MNFLSSACTLMLFSSLSFSQANITSSGGDASGLGGSASFSVGQIDYSNQTNASHNYHEGVQQPFEFFELLSIEESDLEINIYPTPSSDVIHILLYESEVKLSLYDLNGKMLVEKSFSSQTSISLVEYPAAEYLLQIESSGQQSSYKIIKQ